VILGLCFLPFTLQADTTLYACTINGHTTLESTAEKNCDKLQTFHYPTYSEGEGLRPGEIKLLESMEEESNSADDANNAYVNSYADSRQDKCNFYRSILESALAYVGTKDAQFIEIGPTDSGQLQVQIQNAQEQVDYYCR
jgi:hypothetical protein